MGKFFGTDGVRGIANKELNSELAYKLGKAGAYLLSKNIKNPVILIGKDTRISCDMLENALSAGIMSVGGQVVKIGVLPTPAVAYLVRQTNATAGIVISASHNSFEFNGIKFFNGFGFKLDDEIEEEIEKIIEGEEQINQKYTGEYIGRVTEAVLDAEDAYINFLRSTIDVDLSGMKIAVDCANGASYRVAEKVLKSLSAEVHVIGNEPNGININDNCGSTHPALLQKKVVEVRADIGLAFDGDADRLIAVDEQGEIVNGDKIIYICADMLKKEGKLDKNLVTVTIMSNLGTMKVMKDSDMQIDITAVGDRYVLEKMLKSGCVLGGEQSGHIIFLEHSTTGDGLLSALQLLRALKKSGKKMSELSALVPVYPQVLKNASVPNDKKANYMEDEEIANKIKEVEEKMEGDGRVIIRASGTEPLVRVMLEGSDLSLITDFADELANLIQRKMN